MRAAIVVAILLLGGGSAGAQDTPALLTCFAIRDSGARGRFDAVLPPEMGSGTCVIRTPARIACVETRGAQVTPGLANAGSNGQVTTSVLCYRARCTAPRAQSGEVTDALGARSARFKSARLVCLPADAQPGRTTTTVSGATTSTAVPPTTTTNPSGPCTFTNGECRGTCAPGQRCGTAAGTGSCECRSTSCGDASAPECAGACDHPDEACVFEVVGCRCVTVP